MTSINPHKKEGSMSKQVKRLLKNQPKVKVIAQSYDDQKERLVWLLAMAASIAYLFSFFFSFTGGRAPASD
jgi:glycerol-3-phosphate acyltransferase PlsY